MHKHSASFQLKFGNTPLINLRLEFNAHHALLADPAWRAQFAYGSIIEPVGTPYMLWGGMPGAFLTLLLQRAFSGIEAYVVGATHISLGGLGPTAIRQASTKLSNPFALGGRGIAENYYHRAPSLASSAHSLKIHDTALWDRTKLLYAEVRNPVFHGYEVIPEHVLGVFGVFETLADLYRWIDSWCDPDSIMPGAAKSLRARPRGAT